MAVVRQGLLDRIADDLGGRVFVVRHAGEAVCATAVAHDADDLRTIVDAVEAAGRALVCDGVLDLVPPGRDAA